MNKHQNLKNIATGWRETSYSQNMTHFLDHHPFQLDLWTSIAEGCSLISDCFATLLQGVPLNKSSDQFGFASCCKWYPLGCHWISLDRHPFARGTPLDWFGCHRFSSILRRAPLGPHWISLDLHNVWKGRPLGCIWISSDLHLFYEGCPLGFDFVSLD
jgi:hypothetical protein